MKTNKILSLGLLMLIILARYATSQDVDSDVSCLRFVKESLEDPLQSLSTWYFNNNSEGFICGFTGVECWNVNENRVFKIRLPKMGLTGPFPMGIRNCTSIIGLNLSGNYLSGSIPSNLADDLPFIVSLDLSNNNLSGSIPSSIANLTFINILRLDNNHLTGQIPQELSTLKRLKYFSVANNRLSGPVPIFININFPPRSYAHNLGLCGGPLNVCKDEDLDGLFLSGFAIAFPIFTILSTLFMLYRSPKFSTISHIYTNLLPIKKIVGIKHPRTLKRPGILVSDDSSSEERRVKSSLSLTSNYEFYTQVTAVGEFIHRLSLVELKRATNKFDIKNVIGYGNMGVMYKGVSGNGILIAVKRLHKFESFEKEFLSVIQILGRLQHENLVPLVGFCLEMGKKFLVYKFMGNGTLHQWLHYKQKIYPKKMKWATRFKIAKGVARGLTWLHHNKVFKVAHLRISSKCILLDDDFEPKISTFSNAKMMLNASGTFASSSDSVNPNLSHYKYDVYSFGILLLELITGSEKSTWINSLADRSREVIMTDESLMGQGFDDEIRETLKIAEKCIQVQTDGEISMLQVYQAMCATGISNNEISVDLGMNIEYN